MHKFSVLFLCIISKRSFDRFRKFIEFNSCGFFKNRYTISVHGSGSLRVQIKTKGMAVLIMLKREIEMREVDVAEFVSALSGCKGNVYLESEEGDCINLKSRLSALIGIAQIIQGGLVTKATLRCDNPEDESKLFRFALYREIPEKSEENN